jgi:hypothetical protein
MRFASTFFFGDIAPLHAGIVSAVVAPLSRVKIGAEQSLAQQRGPPLRDILHRTPTQDGCARPGIGQEVPPGATARYRERGIGDRVRADQPLVEPRTLKRYPAV